MHIVCMQKEESSRHTYYLESIILTSVIYDKEDGEISTIDIPNFFIKTPTDSKPGEYTIITKIKRVLVDMLVQIDPGKYGTSVVY